MDRVIRVPRYGGGVFARRSILSITGSSSFSGNSAYHGGGVSVLYSSTVDISGNTTFNNNSASFGKGGGVSAWYSSNVYISGNTTFSGNSAWDCGGGGVSAWYSSNVNISGTTTFFGNSARRNGGGVSPVYSSNMYISGSTTFSGNSAGDNGGGVYACYSSNVYISGNTTFSGNSASDVNGGGVSAWYSSNVNISGTTTFFGNSARRNGGGVSPVYSSNVYISGNTTFSGNSAGDNGGGVYAHYSSNVNISGNTTFTGNKARLDGGGIYAEDSNMNFRGDITISSNTAQLGGGIYSDNNTFSIDGPSVFERNVATYYGGGTYTRRTPLILTGNNMFSANSAAEGGGIYAVANSTLSLGGLNAFRANRAHVSGGGIWLDHSNLTLSGFNHFVGCAASFEGGAIYSFGATASLTGNNTFKYNTATSGGGLYACCSKVSVTQKSKFEKNIAVFGGGIQTDNSTFTFTFESNNAAEGGGFYAFDCTVNFPGENVFITNSASNHGGGFTVMHSTLHLNGSTTFKNDSAVSGGGMYISASNADIDGSNYFMNNTAESGGEAIYARYSAVELDGINKFVANTATSKGAAIHAFSNTLILQGISSFVNNSANYGGGIYSESSNLTVVHNRTSYLNNTALRGGAQCFDVNSNFTLHQTAHVNFQDNNATEFGGAIYVEDVPSRSECFFHIQNNQLLDLDTTPLVFEKNTARMRGSVLYGGLLNKCSFTSDSYTSALDLFNISIVEGNGDKGHSISSDPTRLCFCNKSKLNCTEATQSKSIYPGQQVEISVVAIDQSGSRVPALIHTTVHSGDMSEMISYETGEYCTSRNYSVTPKIPFKNLFNQLEVYTSNKSRNTICLIVNITIERCPIGFEPSNSTGECICDQRIWQYTNSCKIDRQEILRSASGTFWLENTSYNNGTPEGFIHHPFCPLDYCTTESKYINLNDPDKQCNDNRSGLLCGKCKEELSLVLGSSQCKECSNNYLALLIPFALAGVLLVILLFLLRLTVAAGTLHGLIFYANIVAANLHIFFSQSSNNPAGIFIAWLNLDLGIQTCFYNGMNAYARTWLDLVFPVYIWVIVGFLVYISDHSVKMTKLLGYSPVPVLATLFLLSYAKVLRAIITALSLTVLHYPHKNAMVWIHDANVSLEKYISLALAALLFLLFLFLPYTLLLLLGQWL